MTVRRTGWIRFAAWLMAIVMAATLFPVSAFSAGEDDSAEYLEETAQPPLVNVIETDDYAESRSDESADSESTEETAEELPEAEETPEEPEVLPEEPEAEGPSSEEPLQELDGDNETFTVRYYSGTTLLSSETVSKGAVPTAIPTVVSSGGDQIIAWMLSDGTVVSVGETPVTANVSYYAWLMPKLETTTHIRYISGVGDGLFKPTDSLTRAQAATILGNLLQTTAQGPFAASFTDVKKGAWYYEPVQLLASYGIVSGYSDGTFRPNNYVTRAEFISMLVRATGVSGGSSKFTDISSHWAKDDIAAAAYRGWVSGYEETDGTFTFRPQRYINRAEAVTVVNGVLGRSADEQALLSGNIAVVFMDVSPTEWYYPEIMEAYIEHDYTRSGSGETWRNYATEGIGLPEGIYSADGKWYMIGSDGLPVYMRAGINEVNGKFYYAPSSGSYFTGNLSSKAGYCVFADGTQQALSNKFNSINGTLFYWNLSTASARKLTAGLNRIDGTMYWADVDGYVVRNNFGAGVVDLGGKKYLSSGYCDIISTGLGYTSATSKPTTIDLQQQTFEYNNNMYYLKSDYSLACDEWIGYLYFGTDCAYTSGDATVDAYVWSVVKNYINNTALTKEQKLLKVYYYIRGGEGSTYAASPFKYRRREIAYQRGRYNAQMVYSWQISSAKRMFTEKAGMCYEWAAIYLFMARRLGFQAYIVVGDVFSSTTRHCWCMIQWDGKWHISDVEIEWGYMAGWYSSQAVYRNLFSQTVSNEYYSTYSNPECSLTYWVREENY